MQSTSLSSPTPASSASPLINRTVLMSDPRHFCVKELNPYSHESIQPNLPATAAEHTAIRQALEAAGVTVIQVPSPAGCPDGVYTANWALVKGDIAIASSLPGPRQGEQPHARQILQDQGKRIIEPPYRFSGQGDALPVGRYLLCGSGYRTDQRMHAWLASQLGYQAISLRTIPALDASGQPVINRLSGWPDSFFYDIDLAIAVLRSDLIAWCPGAFDAESQAKLRALTDVNLIEVDYTEAIEGFACNLVSTGHVAIMSDKAPKLQAAIEAAGLRTVTPAVTQLSKGGGYIRCTTLTLDNA